MAATTDEEMEALLCSFDMIFEATHDFKNGVEELQSLKSNCDEEKRKREFVETNCISLKKAYDNQIREELLDCSMENEQLSKLYKDSLINFADKLEHRKKCHSLKEDMKNLKEECISKEDGHKKAMDLLKQDYATKIEGFEAQIRGLQREKAEGEAILHNLHQDLASHKSHIQTLATRLDRVRYDVETKYNLEIQDLKDCLLIEQEEKNELNKKLQDLEKGAVISRTKLVEEQRDFTSDRQVETLKKKIMSLRKENGILKRKLQSVEG